MVNLLKIHIEDLLRTDERLIDENNEIRGSLIRELANKLDEKLIELLLNDEKARNSFFLTIKNVYVFKHNDFKFFLDENKIDNSYTQYENRIGLAVGSKMLNENQDVVLNFPYKDCVLEGGQSTEEGMDTYFEYNEEKAEYEEKQAKRKEIFFNEILARDEIDRLFEPKAFTNIKKYTQTGEEIPTTFTQDENGVIKDNLIIKGNNLLALHSLKERFSGQVKLIYIDPPYNTGGDSFKYNDSFNKSTWLTFMKNRLNVAKILLHKKGCIFIQIDYIEFANLKLLCDEVFGSENFIQIISIKTATPAGFKVVNPGPVNVTEFILMYTKEKKSFNFKKGFVEAPYQKDYKYYITNFKDDYKDWIISDVKTKALELLGFASEIDLRKQYGKDIADTILDKQIEQFVMQNSNKVFATYGPHKPSGVLKELIIQSKKSPTSILYHNREGNTPFILKGGRLFAFYDRKLKEIDGKLVSSQLLTDFWSDLSWDTLSFEGNVTLKNGKKPERLLKRIIEFYSDENDIILDYHLGSGTTAAVAHKMNRQYIGTEQLDYGENDSIVRLKNVINNDTTGISKTVKWKGGGSFISIELAKNNEHAKELILKCGNFKELISLFDVLYQEFFLHYNVKVKDFKEKISKEENFRNLPLLKQKEIFCKMLDLNQMYVNVSEMEDSRYKLSPSDISLTKDFYQIKD